MIQDDVSLGFAEFFWKDIDFESKVVLDAGTGFGIATSEIAKMIRSKRLESTILSVDIDPEAFRAARKFLKMCGLLRRHSLLRPVSFVRADLSHLPIREDAVDLVVSTRTISDVESYPCRVIRCLVEFHRVLKRGGRVVISDEYPSLKPSGDEEEVAVLRWQLAKALSHLIGRPHANEIFPEDLEFAMRLVGFRKCRWKVFKGEKIPKRRIDYFVTKTTEKSNGIENPQLKQAFLSVIKNVRELFRETGGVFPQRYIMHATK